MVIYIQDFSSQTAITQFIRSTSSVLQAAIATFYIPVYNLHREVGQRSGTRSETSQLCSALPLKIHCYFMSVVSIFLDSPWVSLLQFSFMFYVCRLFMFIFYHITFCIILGFHKQDIGTPLRGLLRTWPINLGLRSKLVTPNATQTAYEPLTLGFL